MKEFYLISIIFATSPGDEYRRWIQMQNLIRSWTKKRLSSKNDGQSYQKPWNDAYHRNFLIFCTKIQVILNSHTFNRMSSMTISWTKYLTLFLAVFFSTHSFEKCIIMKAKNCYFHIFFSSTVKTHQILWRIHF